MQCSSCVGSDFEPMLLALLWQSLGLVAVLQLSWLWLNKLLTSIEYRERVEAGLYRTYQALSFALVGLKLRNTHRLFLLL